ncbi:MAG: efflux RND transporter permease subunit, partial [Hyphomicrobiales bacterium]
MRLSQFFISRPIFAIVLSLFITIVGGIAYVSLGVTQLPDIVPPTVTVTASYPGATAQTVADTVAAPLEQEINGVEGMIYMYSQATADGNLTLTVTFEVGTDIDRAQVLVQNRVATATVRLPDEVRRSGVTVRKRSPDLLLTVHLLSPDRTYDQVYLSNFGVLNVRDKLLRLYGVGDVTLFGVREYSMRIWLNPELVAARNLTAEQVLDALRAQNVQVAGGNLGEPPSDLGGAFQVSLQMKGRLRTPEEFENIVLKSGDDGRIVRLRDVGRVEIGALSYLTNGYADRHPAVIMIIEQQPGSNAVQAANGVKAAMEEMSKSFPQGLEYRI